MNSTAIVTLIITIIAGALLITERLRPDLIALMVMVTLGITGIVSAEDVFRGFSGSAVMTILGISIVSEALHLTGVTNLLGRWMSRVGRGSEKKLMLVTILTSAGLSLFMNNIAAVGVLLPAVMTLSRQRRISPTRLMMPLAFGTILGGMATLLTTSNIIVSGALRDAGYRPYGLLDFLPIGLPIIALGTLYMLTIGRRLMPRYTESEQMGKTAEQLGPRLATLYEINEKLSVVQVLPDSPLANKTLAEGEWATRTGLIVVGRVHGNHTHLAPRGNDVIHAGDLIIVHGQPEREKLEQFKLRSGEMPSLIPQVMDETVVLAELVIAPHSSLLGRTLRAVRFRERYNVNVLAIWREGKPLHTGIADEQLEFGDALLVQGPAHRIHLLHNEPDLILLEEDPDAVMKPGKAGITIAITLVTLAFAALNVIPVAEAVFAGAVLLLLVNSLSMNEAYRGIEWKAIFLIAGMWPLSIAIRTTGLAESSINLLLGWLGTASPILVSLLLLVVSLIITQLMSGQVAALVLAPIALVAAQNIGADPRGLGMAVALGCSLAFITPFGHPVNIMVMSSGGYTTRDFLRIGMPLTVIVIITILLGLRIFWGF